MSLSSPPVFAQRAPRGALVFALLGLFAAQTASAVAIDLVTNGNLGFGQIVATSFSGTVAVSPSGGFRETTGGVLLGNGFGASAASFTVTGDPNSSYSITLPASAQLTAGAASMTVDTFTSDPSGSSNLGLTGSRTITVGAKLHIGANQPASSYSGTFVVIVSYN